MMNENDILTIEKGLLIDVREVNDWEEGHLPNAIHAPLMGLLLNPEKYLSFGKKEKYYIYCKNGGRSGNACSQLQAKGYKVKNVGGII